MALFARHGYAVRVICGSGASDMPGVGVTVIEQLHPGNEECKAAQAELTEGGEGNRPAFERLVEFFKGRFRREHFDWGNFAVWLRSGRRRLLRGNHRSVRW